MKTIYLLFLLLFCGRLFLRAQSPQALEFLKSEIQRTARQRDEAQKKLLEMESLSAEQVTQLSQEQIDLEKKLNRTSRELLQLEANSRISKTAIKRSEAQLAEREQELQALRREQQTSLEEFERITRDMSEQLANARLSAEGKPGPEVLDLAREREDLREKIQQQEQELATVNAARQKDLDQLHRLQQSKEQLTLDLQESRRSEALANAKLGALELRLGSLQQELADQYQQRSELEQEQERLRGVIENLETRLSDAETNRIPKAQFDEISKTLEAALAENLALKNELSRRDDVPDLRKDFEQIRKQRDLLQAKEKTLVSKVDTLEVKLETANRDTRRLDRENRQLQQQLNEEQKIRETMAKDIADLEGILKEAKAAGIKDQDLEDVALLVAEMEREKEAFRKEALTHRKNVDIMRAELDNQSSSQQVQIRELQNMLAIQIEDITKAQRKISELEGRSRQLDEVRAQKQQLVNMQEKSREDMRTLAKHIYELRSEVVEKNETQRKAVLAIQKNQELAGELDEVRKEMDRVRRINQTLLREENSNDERIREIRRELEIGRARSEALEREKRALLLEVQNLQRKALESDQ